MMDQGRLLYLDNLRALAMLLGVFFHAALAYSPMAAVFWPSADAQQHWGFDVFAWASHLFRMPLFFLLAGFFTAMLLQKSGGRVFFRNRMRRILVPLLIFLPALIVWMEQVIAFGMQHVQQQSALLQALQQLQALPQPPPMPLSTLHLWFLYHLLFLYLLTWCGRILISPHWRERFDRLKPNQLLLGCIVVIVPALYSVSLPFPAPEWIFPALWALWFYGVFFALGYYFFTSPQALSRFEGDRHVYFIVGCLCFVFYYAFLPASLQPELQPQGRLKLALTVFQASAAVCWTIAALLYGKCWLNRRHAVLSYLSQVSYWVYLVHLPLLFFIQFVLNDLDVSLWLKFCSSVCVTFALCLLSYHGLVAWNGMAKLVGATGNDTDKKSA